MPSTAAVPARTLQNPPPLPQMPDPSLAQLGAAMRVAESADRTVDGLSALAPALPGLSQADSAPFRRAPAGPAVRACPRCYSPDMAPTRRQTLSLKLLGVFGIARFRCHSCGKRSWWF